MNIPPKSKPLDYKQIFQEEIKLNRTIDKYKVRLIIKDYQ